MEGLNVNEAAAPIDYSVLTEPPKNLDEALEHTALIFSRGFDEIEAVKAKVAVDRAQYVNFVIDFAKAEGMPHKDIIGLINDMIFKPAVDGGTLASSTGYQYKSGLVKALAHGKAWCPKSFELPAIEVPGKAKRGRPKTKAASKAVTVGEVKVDRKARTVELKLGKSTDLEAFTEAVTAVQSEPGRIALFLAYCKAQGWTK